MQIKEVAWKSKFFLAIWLILVLIYFGSLLIFVEESQGGYGVSAVLGICFFLLGGWIFLSERLRCKFLLATTERERRHLLGCWDRTTSALYVLEEQSNTLLKWTSDAVVIHRGGAVIYMNQAALKMFRVPASSSRLGSQLSMLVHADYEREELNRWQHSVTETAIVSPYESRYLTCDGEQILVEVVHRQVKLAGDGALQSHFRDVTRDREDAIKYKRLIRSHRTLESAIERHSLVLKIDVDGTITYVNDPFVILCGLSSEELVGKAYRMLRAPVQSLTVWNNMHSQISTGRAWSGELCLKRRNGAHKWVNVLVSPFFDDAGLIASYTILQTDITDYVQAKQLARDRLLGTVAE
jgi:PAS domain S-box-containing protein